LPPAPGSAIRHGRMPVSASPRPRRDGGKPRGTGAGALAALALLVLAGCGHPASVEECNTIIEKSAELELRAQNVTDPAVIAQRTDAVKSARGKELLGRCVGKRITNRALGCVEHAGSPKDVDRCLE
jgi:hypothetical protein